MSRASLHPALLELVRLLAELAVDEYLSEQYSSSEDCEDSDVSTNDG